MIDKLMNIEDAIAMVKDGDTIWINSFSAVASPVELNIALTQRGGRWYLTFEASDNRGLQFAWVYESAALSESEGTLGAGKQESAEEPQETPESETPED